ncbi:chemotaxis protein histidine kinase CheA [Kitasatospora sp. MAP12-15]|uniref:hypothetical protein n=1 Tax=unclassified Kitasatospora TaxID=2633591 RepID=UPI002474C32B|nr:hypothetical protein [Kitasatospora sp. MAP12-44]MDH6112480.1 chemotaxis protein histidine kinase CheA [Kitasatospora sp. MAP12-44]
MSDAVPSYGFTAARRGYAPEQVEHTLHALTAQRDEAWQRLSMLGAHIRALETQLAEVAQAAADAPDPDYALLSEQALALMAMAENEAQAIRDKAERFAEDTRDSVYDAGQELTKAAAEYAETTRTEADLAARRTEERTRAEAEKLRGEANREARALRDAATGEAAKTRVEAAEAGERAEVRLAEMRREADELFAVEESAAAAADAEVAEAAERRLREAEQHRETVLGQIKQTDTDAQAKADQLLERARREAEQVNATLAGERVEFEKRQETVQTHLDHIKGTLASLTGKAVGMIEPGQQPQQPAQPQPQPLQPAQAAPPVVAASEADTGEVPVPAPVPAPALVLPQDAPTTVLRLPVELREAAAAQAVRDARPATATPTPPTAADPRTALLNLPPRPATPPPAPPQDAPPQDAPRPSAAEDATAIIPKIVIIDDGTELDSLPNTVGRRRT